MENVAGAGGAIGVNKGLKSPADGYTIVMGIVSDVVLAPLTESAVTYTLRTWKRSNHWARVAWASWPSRPWGSTRFLR